MRNLPVAMCVAALVGWTSLAQSVQAAAYRLLLESDADEAGGAELYAVTYNSFADFLSNPLPGGSYSAINIASGFSAVGFAYDGQYRLLLESDADKAGGAELFAVTYDSFADFLSNPLPGGSYSAINIASGFSAVGFAYDGQYRLLLESNVDEAGGAELFAVTYDSFADFLSNPLPGGSYSAINIASGFSAVGFAYDGQYRLLLESNVDEAGGAELFAVTYDSFADFLSNPLPGGSYSAINIASRFSGAGFAFERDPPDPTAVPEPYGLGPFVTGLAALLFTGFRKRRSGDPGHRLDPRGAH